MNLINEQMPVGAQELRRDGKEARQIIKPTERPDCGKDQVKLLAAQPGGRYEASLLPPEAGRWLVTIEDPEKTWRLSGKWHLPEERAAVLESPGERSAGVR